MSTKEYDIADFNSCVGKVTVMSPVMLPTETPVDAVFEKLKPRRAEDGRALLAIYERVTGLPAVVWGPSIIGFGQRRYENASGGGIEPLAAFAPRAAHQVVYLQRGFQQTFADELQQLGPHKTGAVCLYITSLAKVDLQILESMIAADFNAAADN